MREKCKDLETDLRDERAAHEEAQVELDALREQFGVVVGRRGARSDSLLLPVEWADRHRS